MTSVPQNRGLGRGLAALLGDVTKPVYVNGPGVTNMPVAVLGPSPFQPRRKMDETALQELAESIRHRGVLQPLLVRPMPGVDGAYQIIAGERRWRAAQLAELHDVPVLIRQLSDQDAMAAGLVENLQREDLNEIEEAEGYQRLLTEFRLTQERLAEAVGKSRTHIAHMVRILKLPESVLDMVKRGLISVGHARALTNHPNPAAAAQEITAKNLTVRQTEDLVNDTSQPERLQRPPAPAPKPVDPEIAALANGLSEKLGLRVNISFDGKGGALTMHYKSLDQLDEVLSLLNG